MLEKVYTKGGNRKKKEEAKTNPYLVANKLNQIKLKWERERERNSSEIMSPQRTKK